MKPLLQTSKIQFRSSENEIQVCVVQHVVKIKSEPLTSLDLRAENFHVQVLL